jgi:dCTP deaminase
MEQHTAPLGHSPSMFPELVHTDTGAHTTGILPCQSLEALSEAGYIRASEPLDPAQVQPASLDLRLGAVAYELRASFLPGKGRSVAQILPDVVVEETSLENGATLRAGHVYLIPLLESLNLPQSIFGKTNPKSTTGRLDIFVRVITDYGEEFERVSPGYKGPLFAEVASRTFNVIVRKASRLNQLRLVKGNPMPSDARLFALRDEEILIYKDDETPGQPLIARGLWLSLDLGGLPQSGVVGYRALKDVPAIDVDCVGYYDPSQFWQPIPPSTNGQLVIEPGSFYILGSREKVRVPPRFAAEMVNYDPAMGEFHVHYAGFFDPGFGYGNDDVRGTRAVLEIRPHDVPFLLRDRQRIGRLIYERLLEQPRWVYGRESGSSYQHQESGLGKQFKAWIPETTQLHDGSLLSREQEAQGRIEALN